MKKLLILMLVLGLTSMASATLQISVHNSPKGNETWDPMNPQDSDIYITPSQHLILDIWTDASIGYQEGVYYALVCDTALGSIPFTSGVVSYADSGLSINQEMSAQEMGFPLPLNEDGVGGGAFCMDVTTGIPAGTKLFDEFDFHCEDYGDVVIKLYSSIDGSVLVLDDSVVIHQIPEPATMLLLGLGGLLLRRRK